MDGFTPLQLDALKEISSISAGSASTALSQFINKTVKMHPPDIVPLSQTADCCSYGETDIVIMHSQIHKGLVGKIIFTCSRGTLRFLFRMLLGDEHNTSRDCLSEMEQSSLKEIGMMMFGSYVKVLGGVIGRPLLIKPPQLWIGIKEESAPYISEHILVSLRNTLCFKSHLWVEEETLLSIFLVFIPQDEYIRVLLEAVGFTNRA